MAQAETYFETMLNDDQLTLWLGTIGHGRALKAVPMFPMLPMFPMFPQVGSGTGERSRRRLGTHSTAATLPTLGRRQISPDLPRSPHISPYLPQYSTDAGQALVEAHNAIESSTPVRLADFASELKARL